METNETITLSQLANEFTEATFALMIAACTVALAGGKRVERDDEAIDAINALKERFAARVEEITTVIAAPRFSSREGEIYTVGYTIETINGSSLSSGLQVWETTQAKSEEEAIKMFHRNHASTLTCKYLVQWVNSRVSKGND